MRRWICFQGKTSHTFSDASFEATYWLKRRNLLASLAQGVSEGESLRGLARSHQVSEHCVTDQVMRVGRLCWLLHLQALDRIDPESLGMMVLDELESWEVSQLVPTTHALMMDGKSGFKLLLHAVPMNRKGRMSAEQKAKYDLWVQKYGTVPKNASFHQLQALLKILNERVYSRRSSTSEPIRVASDEKPSYPSALRNAWSPLSFTHFRFKGDVGRNVGIMGKINAEDLYLRQRCATMRRETLDSMKRHNNTSLRHAIYLMKRNFVMPKQGTNRSETPATRLELADRPMSWAELLSRRVLGCFKKILPEYLVTTYLQERRTAFYSNNQVLKVRFVS